MFTTIVVGTDGSATARAAVQQAAALARTHGAAVRLVCAYKPVSSYPMVPEALPAQLHALVDPAAEARRVLDEEAAKVRAEGVAVDTHPMAGDPASAIIEVAEATGADLIVVGNRGMSGAARFLLGSVPNKVSHHAPCSVLIVRTS